MGYPDYSIPVYVLNKKQMEKLLSKIILQSIVFLLKYYSHVEVFARNFPLHSVRK